MIKLYTNCRPGEIVQWADSGPTHWCNCTFRVSNKHSDKHSAFMAECIEVKECKVNSRRNPYGGHLAGELYDFTGVTTVRVPILTEAMKRVES